MTSFTKLEHTKFEHTQSILFPFEFCLCPSDLLVPPSKQLSGDSNQKHQTRCPKEMNSNGKTEKREDVPIPSGVRLSFVLSNNFKCENFGSVTFTSLLGTIGKLASGHAYMNSDGNV